MNKPKVSFKNLPLTHLYNNHICSHILQARKLRYIDIISFLRLREVENLGYRSIYFKFGTTMLLLL